MSKFVIDGEHGQWTCDDCFFLNIPNNWPIWAYGLNELWSGIRDIAIMRP